MERTEDIKRKNFRDILYELAKNQNVLKDPAERVKIYVQFENLYYINEKERFRHFYSDIFSVLTTIESDSSLGDINILGENLKILREGYQRKNPDSNGNLIDISDSLKKLYDHVNLDIARILYSSKQDKESTGEEKLNDLKAHINSIEEKIPQIEINIEDAQIKLKDSQKEYIAILGIFSAVVLAFSGAVAFSTSVLENIHQASIYRIGFVCCVIGLVAVDIIYLMFSYVNKIVHESKEKAKEQNLPIIIINITFVLIMILITLAWAFGIVEKRNLSINEFPNTTQAIEETTVNSQETHVPK